MRIDWIFYSVLVSFFLGAFAQKGMSQELNISVTVQAPNSSITDPRVFKTMESQIEEFLNTTQWTTDEFEPEERIEGNLLITVTREIDASNFIADFTIQSIRPVFNSTYRSKLLNYKDPGISFTYIENQPIQNSSQKYFDNLSSVLTFYAYVILGLDYDTFSKLGGEKYYSIANNMIQALPSNVALSGGWSPAQGVATKRGRYYIIENVFNPRMRGMREAMYIYHRKGLDAMYEDVGKGKAVLLSALKSVEKANNAYPNSMMVQLFTDSKNDELIEIFLGADRAEKLRVYDILVSIDPYRASKFAVLKQN